MASKLRYGFIGTGLRGCGNLRDAGQLPQVEVAAVADPYGPSRDRALALCPDPQAVRVYQDYRDLLADPDLDVVVISSPNHTHAEIVAEAVQHDKHIFCEKPLAHTPEAAARIVELTAAFPRTFWVGLQMRYAPALAYLRQQVEAGVCGDVKMLTLREHRGPFQKKVGDWIRFNRYSGGTLVEKSCHHFDLFNLLARSKPVRVYASGGADVNDKDEIHEGGERPDILDNAFVVVDYEDGKRALLELCMFHPGAPTHPHTLVSVLGDEGYVQWTTPGNEVVVERFDTKQNHRVTPEEQGGGGGHSGADPRVHRAFLDCVLSGRRPETDAYTGALSVYVGAAAERSAREGRPVLISEIEPKPDAD